MEQPTYTLSWILPFVRQALKQTSNFEYRTYANALLFQLEQAQVKGVVRFQQGVYSGGQIYHYDQIPFDLRALIAEAYFYLFHKGYIAPEPPDSTLNPPHLHMFRVTKRGRLWFQGEEPLPEDAACYMKFLRERVPLLDPVVEQYVLEALSAFEKEAYFAAAVMLGAASEKSLYLLAESLLDAFSDLKKLNKLQSILQSRKLLDLFEFVRDEIQNARKSKTLPYPEFEGSVTHLMALYEAIRVQRNDAVHPMNAVVSEGSVRLLIQSFPYSLSKSEELRVWFTNNPKSI
jgi:hypothetical protein